ncbi:hypothetical protein Hanom_Chr07g00661371 [Helianthus anomalus]
MIKPFTRVHLLLSLQTSMIHTSTLLEQIMSKRSNYYFTPVFLSSNLSLSIN